MNSQVPCRAVVLQLDRRIQSSNARLQTPGIIDPLEAERQDKADAIAKEIESMLEEVCEWRHDGAIGLWA
jgi:hypothetical protein